MFTKVRIFTNYTNKKRGAKKTFTGFSAIEILVAIAILSFLIVLGINNLSGLRGAVELDNSVESVVSIMREARSKTLGPEDASQFGVHFEGDKATLFKGTEFAEGAEDNRVYELPDGMEIFDINFSEGVVVFQFLTGEPLEVGNISIRALKNPGVARIIFVNNAGLIYVE